MNDSTSPVSERPRRRRGAFVLFVLAALALGAAAYNVGWHQGAARTASAAALAQVQAQAVPPGSTPPAMPPGAPPYGYPGHWYGYGHHGPSLFPTLLFVAVAFFALRAFFWGGPWRHHMAYCGPGRFARQDEWHRQAHEGPIGHRTGQAPPADTPTTG
jgi:hypothetical protein